MVKKLEMLKTKEKCAITGLPAKYRDPVTGLPYANLDAFKIIREQHTPKQSEELAVLKHGESGQSETTNGAHSESSARDTQTCDLAEDLIESSESGTVTSHQLSKLGNSLVWST